MPDITPVIIEAALNGGTTKKKFTFWYPHPSYLPDPEDRVDR